MPVQYNILYTGFKNILENGKITGFQVKCKTGYYRGVWLPIVEYFEVTIDGEKFARDQISVATGGRTLTQDQMDTASDVFWQWDEPATLIVKKPGGLKIGVHDVEVSCAIRVSYGPAESKPRPDIFRAKLALVS